MFFRPICQLKMKMKEQESYYFGNLIISCWTLLLISLGHRFQMSVGSYEIVPVSES